MALAVIEFSVLYNELTTTFKPDALSPATLQTLSNKCFSFPFIIKTGFCFFFCRRQPHRVVDPKLELDFPAASQPNSLASSLH